MVKGVPEGTPFLIVLNILPEEGGGIIVAADGFGMGNGHMKYVPHRFICLAAVAIQLAVNTPLG